MDYRDCYLTYEFDKQYSIIIETNNAFTVSTPTFPIQNVNDVYSSVNSFPLSSKYFCTRTMASFNPANILTVTYATKIHFPADSAPELETPTSEKTPSTAIAATVLQKREDITTVTGNKLNFPSSN
mmetsp:Transcript_8956/g.11566  ORF Transcript_8956/g.11566 Transcript_8956/m.11566 type:complete len:126 (+) Transcript_8956:53-430(+)